MCEELNTKVFSLLPATAKDDGPSARCPEGQQDDGPSVRWPEGQQDDGPSVRWPEGQRDDGPSVRWHEGQPDDGADILTATVEALKAGHVVALPTDTVYGLACLAQNSEAVKTMYDIKGRDGRKPLAVCVGAAQDVHTYCKVSVEAELLGELLPGPVTLLFERSDALNPLLNPFTALVGVRVPDHAFLRRLCRTCGEPLALTSANVSARPSAVAAHQFRDLWPRLAVVVDGGPIGDQSRLGSTVVDLSVRGRYSIVRRGRAFSSTVDLLERKYGLQSDG